MKFSVIGKDHHMLGLSLEVVMDKFSILAFLNYRNFVYGLKHFVHSGTGTMDSIIAFKDHSTFKFVHDSRFSGKSKDKVFVIKISIDLPGSGMEHVKRIHIGGNMDIFWTMSNV